MAESATEKLEGETGGESPSKRILYFDLLTIFACFAVVILHCNGSVHGFRPEASWDQALFAEVFFFWAVPVFFMLTGANNMGYRRKRGTKEFLARRMKKLLIPFLFWSIAAYLYQGIATPNGTGMSVMGFISAFMSNSIMPIYWFFFAIISLTLAMPALSLLANNRKVLWYIVVAQFILGSTLPVLSRLTGFPWSTSFNLPIANSWVMFAILGYLLATEEVPRKWRIALYFAGIASLCFRFGYTYINSYAIGKVDGTLSDYGAFTTVLPAVAVFLLFKYAKWDKTLLAKHPNGVTAISSCSFGIYLIHIFILENVLIGAFGLTITSAFIRIIGPFIVYGSSLVIVAILRRIPVLREVIP